VTLVGPPPAGAGVVQHPELVGGDDVAGLAGHRGSAYLAPRVERHDLIGERRGEDGVEREPYDSRVEASITWCGSHSVST
jgi:hypothetical protein